MHGPPDSVLDSSTRPARADTDALLLAACEQLEGLLRSGQAARAETFLSTHPALAGDAEAALDLIYLEYSTRRELGESPTHEEYFGRFPQWRDLLQRQFQLETLIDPLPPLAASEGRDGVAPNESGKGSTPGAALPTVAPAGRFRVKGVLARGGIGQVMRATDTELHREVAVKELQPALADYEEVRERFLREAEITGKLEHPGVVPVYGLGRDATGRPFYAMRLVHGQSFQQAAEEFHRGPEESRRYGGLEFQKLLRRFLQVCHTMAYAHSRGVIHRDVKPENILLGPFGETLVVDWGLAKVTGESDGETVQTSSAADQIPEGAEPDSLAGLLVHGSSDLTRDAGEWMGTPAYMCPEQAQGQAHSVGPAGDVYSLGATLYMLLTGDAPLAGCSVEETLRRVIAGEFPRPRELCRAVPPPLEAICLRAMARRPDDRYPSPNDLADDLERWLADEPVTALHDSVIAQIARWGRRNRTRVVAAAIALLVVTVVSLSAAVLINGERLRTERQRVEADRRTARLAFDRGYALSQDHEYGAGLLWYARALEHVPREDEPLRRVILTNMNAARHRLLRRRSTFAHGANLASAAISADGKQLATADYDGLARLWDVDSGKILAERRLPRRARGAQVPGDGTVVFATVAGTKIELESLPEGSALSSWPATIDHGEEVDYVAFDADGRFLVTAGHASEGSAHVRLWKRSGGDLAAEFTHPKLVRKVLFRPGHEEVATVGSDGRLRIWNWKSAGPQWELKLEAGQVEQVAFTPNGKRMLLGDSEGVLSCYDVDARRREFELARESGVVTAVSCAADGQTVAAAWSNGTARTWSLSDRRQLWEWLRIDRHTEILKFRPKTRQMLVASEPRSAVLWDTPDSSPIGAPLEQGQMTSVAFSLDGKIAITGSANGSVVVRDAPTGKLLHRAKSHQKLVAAVALSPDGALALSASHDGIAQLFKTDSGQSHGQPMDHREAAVSVQVEAAAFSPDGRYVLTGDNIGRIHVWDAASGDPVRPLADHEGAVRSLCLNSRGDRVLAGFSTPESCIRMWDFTTGKLLWTGRHGNTVRSVRFSPNDDLVLSASNDVTARLWRAADGSPVGSSMSHRGEVFVATFSPDGQIAATGGYDATVRLWEVPTGRPIGEPMQHDGIVTAVVFSSDGKRLITAGSLDRTARLWDVTTCLPLSPPMVHNGNVMSVGLDRSGQVAYTGRLWRLPAPLPDEPQLLGLWVKLATQRTFSAADNVEWLRPDDVAAAANEFQSRTGSSWEEWGTGH